MSQGSNIMNPSTQATPAAVVGAPINSITQQWKAIAPCSTAFEHVIYALLRQRHGALNASDENFIDSDDFKEQVLRKLARTCGPLRRPSKIRNANGKPFATLITMLYRISIMGLGHQGRFELTQEQFEQLRAWAKELHMEVRAGGDNLLQYTPAPAPREKKPYTGSR